MITEIQYKVQHIDSDISRPHFHSGYEILYVSEGCVELEINYSPHTVKAPAIILLNPFEWHRITRAKGAYRRYMLVLEPSLFEQSIHTHLVTMVKCRPIGFRHIVPLGSNEQKTVNTIFDTLMSEEQHEYPYKEQLITNEISSLLILIYRISDSNQIECNERVLEIQRYIDNNYQTIEHIQDLADHFFLSREYIARAFKKFAGYSPMEYLLRTRLYQAQILLLTTDDTIAEICEKTGFRDINNFIRQFKKKYGIPPLAFRKKNHSDFQIPETVH